MNYFIGEKDTNDILSLEHELFMNIIEYDLYLWWAESKPLLKKSQESVPQMVPGTIILDL